MLSKVHRPKAPLNASFISLDNNFHSIGHQNTGSILFKEKHLDFQCSMRVCVCVCVCVCVRVCV